MPSDKKLAYNKDIILSCLIFCLCGMIISMAFFYEWKGYLPCELCYKERISYYITLIIMPIIIILQIFKKNRICYFIFIFLIFIFLFNSGLSIYHLGVEQKIFTGPEDCSGIIKKTNDINIFYEQLKTVKVVRCDSPNLWIFGLSLTNWNIFMSLLIAFIALKATNLHRYQSRAGS